MKTSIKAALLSALVFPGSGHLFLKAYLTGIALVSSFSLLLYFIMIDVIDKVDYVVQQIETGNLSLDMSSISELLLNQSVGLNSQTTNLMTWLMGLIWLIAILDAYRVGRAKNINE